MIMIIIVMMRRIDLKIYFNFYKNCRVGKKQEIF